MNPELEETIHADFITSLPTTGAAADADTTPICEIFEDASDTAIVTPTVTKRVGKTGNYRVPIACTSANGFEAGKSYNVIVTATVGSVVAKAVLQTFQMRTNGADDLAASILTRATPAQVQAELATYGAAKPGNAMTLTAPYDPAKTAAQVGSAMTLTSAYDPAKTAATQASVNAVDDFVDTEVGAIKSVTDKLDTALELDGAVYRYTTNALEQAPVGGGGGGTDWTSLERDQIRHRLGIDGIAAAPAASPSLASQTTVLAIESVTDKLDTMVEADGAVWRYTANALEQAPVGTGGNGGSPAPAGSPCFENPARTTGPTTEPPAFAQAVQRVKVWRPSR